MGMAASQARLLSITARIHDIEYAAQNVQNAKLQLATQQDAVYEEYLRALDAVTLTFASRDGNGVASTLTATFNTLFSENAAHTATGSNYALIDSRNRVIVSDEIYEGYLDFEGSSYTQSAYNFAMFMIYGDEGMQNAFDPLGSQNDPARQFINKLLEAINSKLPDENGEGGDTILQGFLENFFGDDFEPGTQLTLEDLKSIVFAGDNESLNQSGQQILNTFFNQYGGAFFNEIDYENEQVGDFNYYMRMFNVIQQHGGCISIDDFNENTNDNAANNSDWLTMMIQSGQFSIEQINVDNHGNVTTSGVGVDSDSNMKYSNNTEIDRAAMARAEANYEHAMKIIDRKGKKHDMELKKLETERTALTKEYDSVKKVIDDNIDRSFGIFS